MGKPLTQDRLDTLRAANDAFERGEGCMEECSKQFGLGRYTNYRKTKRTTEGACGRGQIDLMLEILMMILEGMPVELTQSDLADICGCSQARIYLIEKSALRKLERAFLKRQRTELAA